MATFEELKSAMQAHNLVVCDPLKDTPPDVDHFCIDVDDEGDLYQEVERVARILEGCLNVSSDGVSGVYRSGWTGGLIFIEDAEALEVSDLGDDHLCEHMGRGKSRSDIAAAALSDLEHVVRAHVAKGLRDMGWNV